MRGAAGGTYKNKVSRNRTRLVRCFRGGMGEIIKWLSRWEFHDGRFRMVHGDVFVNCYSDINRFGIFNGRVWCSVRSAHQYTRPGDVAIKKKNCLLSLPTNIARLQLHIK